TNHPVTNIETIKDKVKVEFLNKSYEIFDKVILTLPSEIAGKICKDLTEEERKKLQNIKYLGIVCPSVVISKSISPFYITNITDDGLPFTGIIEMTNIVDKKDFGGNSLIYLPKYVASDDSIFNLPDDEIEEIFTENLLKMYPYLNRNNIISF